MFRELRIYSSFIRSGIQVSITYRFDFFAYYIRTILYCFIIYFIWKAVFISNKGASFMGFSMLDMAVFLFVTSITGIITSCQTTGDVGSEIKDGSFSMRLIKPISYDLSYLFSEIGKNIFALMIIFIPIILGIEIYRFYVSGKILFSTVNFLEYIISVSLSFILSFYLSICFGYCTFFVKNIWGFSLLKTVFINFLSGSMIPIAFMPHWAQNIMNAMPFSSLSYTPVMIYMGKYSFIHVWQCIALQIVWIAAFWAISKLIWHLAINHVTVQGG